MSAAAVKKLERSSGRARISFKNGPDGTALDDLYQKGCTKVRFPRHDGARPQAVLLNTSGGLTDGDELVTEIEWGIGTGAVITSQAAERIYRSRGGDACIRTELVVARDATALWVPQETILFDGARLQRKTLAKLTGSSRLLAIESLVFGRTAMGEVVRTGSIDDGWRVQIDGKLEFADRLRINSDNAPFDVVLSSSAGANGHVAMATIVFVDRDCGRHVPALRSAMSQCRIVGGVSNLGPLLHLRLLAATGHALRDGLVSVFDVLVRELDETLPRVWQI